MRWLAPRPLATVACDPLKTLCYESVKDKGRAQAREPLNGHLGPKRKPGKAEGNCLGSNPRRQKETKFVNTAGELIIGIRKKD